MNNEEAELRASDEVERYWTDYHLQDWNAGALPLGPVAAAVFGAIVVGVALVLVGAKRIRSW